VSPLNDFQFDVLEETTPVLVDFYADWCAPCRALSSRLETLSQELKSKLKIVKVNIEDHPDVAAKYGIRSLPTLIRFEQGEPVRTFVGNPVGDALMSLAY
jgi:thioredoxin 1